MKTVEATVLGGWFVGETWFGLLGL